MTLWFTSDQHYGHRNIIKYCKRPFSGGLLDRIKTKLTGEVSDKSVSAMNEELIARHNSLVSPSDTVIHLGDFSLSFEVMQRVLPRLNGEHHLIMGNHDHCHPATGKKKAALMEELYVDAGFTSVSKHLTIQLLGQYVLLHHFPYATSEGDKHGRKFDAIRPKDNGLILLHGHVHNAWKVRGSMINVGVDVWDFKPVSKDQIESLILDIKMKVNKAGAAR